MTEGLRSIRPLAPNALQGIQPAPASKRLPRFEWVSPKDLFVEEKYQRDVRANGIRLIRKIYAGFNWAHFKPPVCVRLPESGNVLVCIDGQHTATAAASHPAIDKIPVMVVGAEDVAARAAAFVGHNRDRLGLTPPMIYYAELAAGEALAVVIDRACKAAGAHVMPTSINLRENHPVGATIAIGTMRAIAKRQGEAMLVRVLQILVGAKRGPIKADEIAAVALILLSAPDERDIDKRLGKIVESKTTEQWAAFGAMKASHSGEPLPSAVASCWCEALGMSFGGMKVAPTSVKSGARLIDSMSKASKPPAAPKVSKAAPIPLEPPKETPSAAKWPKQLPPAPQQKPALMQQKPPVAQQPAPPIVAPGVAHNDPARFVSRNGVVLDLRDRRITHRGLTTKLPDEGIRLVASLARVMPSIMDPGVLARQAFGRPVHDPKSEVRMLTDRLNPLLRGVRLEIKTVPNIGNTLFDLGAE